VRKSAKIATRDLEEAHFNLKSSERPGQAQEFESPSNYRIKRRSNRKETVLYDCKLIPDLFYSLEHKSGEILFLEKQEINLPSYGESPGVM